ncbi:MAG: allantoate amidohydrolase [Actinomycetota bacterium]|nr:allantoate amidohydrolase [Actinomycetota bacterium]
MSFDSMWAALEQVGRNAESGGYRRYAWTKEDATLREWFAGEAAARGLHLVEDRVGNQWAWWGDPDAAAASGRPGVVVGSHLDSVPDGGAFDGPLGVISAFAALDALRAQGFVPDRPVAVVNFGDEEGARFGVACGGSRLLTGALDANRALSLIDGDGVSMADALVVAGRHKDQIGPDPEALRRIGAFVELHIEQGRGLVHTGHAVAVASSIWPHGRWRLDLEGEANHAGTTRLDDRRDPMLALADVVTTARHSAHHHGCVATIGKVTLTPNAVNAIPSRVTAWLDARGPDEDSVRAVVSDVSAAGGGALEESWTTDTAFDANLRDRVQRVLGGVPILTTGAGHDAGILAAAGVPTAMLFVRNPTGVSHSPAEYAERADCLAGVDALREVIADLAGPDRP